MPIDLQYLLFLQNIRQALGGSFDELFNAISKIAVTIMKLLPYMVFWCVSTKWGYRFLATFWGGEVSNGLIKLTVCAYRPWIRSDAIEPAGDSKVAATGYSFPSGHTVCAGTMYGTTAVWQRRTRRWLSVSCIVLVLLTMFSRNFLGVHTPQDVIVGCLESCLLIFIAGRLMNYLEGKEKAADYLTFAGVVVVAAALIYIMFKPYPMDYVDGKLLVNPQNMMNDAFKACGGFLGLLIGSYVERHYVHYQIPQGHKDLAALTAVGLGLLTAWNEYLAPATIVLALGKHWGNFLANGLMVFFAVALYPMLIRKFTQEK